MMRKADTQIPRGIVAIPAFEWMWTQSALAFMAIQQRLPRGSGICTETGVSSPAGARNHMIERFLEMTGDPPQWILFIDSDMTPPADVVTRLLAHEKDIVSGLCTTRHPPFRATVGLLPDPASPEKALLPANPHGLHEVAWVGAACLLVRRRVLEAMGSPWFEHSAPGVGEDLVFCHKARALGFPVFVDFDLHPGHLTALAVSVNKTNDGASIDHSFGPGTAAPMRA